MIDSTSAYFNKRLEEVMDMRKVDTKMKRELGEHSRQERISLRVHNDSILKAAKREVLVSRRHKLSKRQRLRNIRTNRSNERDKLRAEQSWTGQSSFATPNDSNVVPLRGVGASSAGPRQQLIGDILFNAMKGSTEND